jgi:predicted AlkP superfamily phosphohydrolase/phosphomutase
MTEAEKKLSRRTFLKGSVLAATAGVASAGAGGYWLGSQRRASRALGKKIIIIGVDGMDPVLCARMMKAGQLPNLAQLRDTGTFSELGTSIPPQSPVAWANFINGAGPGSHGIFDFIHRHPEDPCKPFYAAAETLPGKGGWDVGKYRVPLNFWPFNDKPPSTVLRRQGVPFWAYLDAAGIPTTFYDLPSNYPPTPSAHGHHRCLSGLGTPDMLGSYGTYQYFAEDVPEAGVEEGGGKRSRLTFDRETAQARIVGPDNTFLRQPQPVTIDFQVYRDRRTNAAAIEIQGRKLLLRAGQWSHWIKLDFDLSTPAFLRDKHAFGVVRFFLQQVAPVFRLYMTPVNIDPADPVVQISEPASFVKDLAKDLGLFYTTGFQEDHKARSNGVFSDSEYLKQASFVLEERLALLDRALDNYDDGLLFFYFSSSDLQSHIFWWDSNDKHPVRSASEAKKYFGHIHQLYRRLDQVVGDLMDRYGGKATLIVMSDHGFANFGRQFNLNTWLRENGYLGPPQCTSVMQNVDWSLTYAYGLGINGLYLNLKGRERDGIVEPGEQAEHYLAELKERLEAVTDDNGQPVIRSVYRADQVYSGNATALAPDLIIGYRRGYRASWATCLGDLTDDVLLDNDSAWSADHCADALEVPGVFFSNRALRGARPSLVDVAPSILAEFGLPTPAAMSGKNVFA